MKRHPFLPEIGKNDIDLCRRANFIIMKKEKYETLFKAFEKAPMEEFLETIFEDTTKELRDRLILEDVSYHRHSADIVTLEVWMVLSPLESNQWILARVEMDRSTGMMEEMFLARDSYRKMPLNSIEDCVIYYQENNK